MPAIQIHIHGQTGVLLPVPARKQVQVKLKDGTWTQAEFLGFMCQAGAKMLGHTHFAKIYAIYVTCENIAMAKSWRPLYPDQGDFVLGVRLERHPGHGLGQDVCVYALVDAQGWPIVMRDPVL